eukprot:SAG22_NODE_4261_length_1325_cov_1.040783_2_plen_110_part_00
MGRQDNTRGEGGGRGTSAVCLSRTDGLTEPQQRATADQTSTPSISTLSTSPSRESIAQLVQETSQDVMSAGMSTERWTSVQSFPHGPWTNPAEPTSVISVAGQPELVEV